MPRMLPTVCEAAAASRLEHEYPVGADFLDTYVGMSRDALRADIFKQILIHSV